MASERVASENPTSSVPAGGIAHGYAPDLLARARAQAFESVFDAVVVTDLAGTIVDWNAGSEKLYGYRRDEALGQPVSMLHVPEDSAHLTAEVIGRVQAEGRWQGEIRMLHKDGHIGWIESMVVPLSDEAGEPVGALGINRDITGRRQTEENLRAAEARFRSLVEHSLVGIYMIRGQRFLYANPRFTEIFGYTRDELLGGVLLSDLIAEEDRAQVEENLRRRFAGERMEEPYSFGARRKDGQIIEAQVYATRIEIDGDHAVLGMVQDITDQHRAEERLQASEELLSGIISNAMEAIIAVDADQRIVVFNESAERTFRCAAEEALGTPLDRFIPRRFRRVHREHVQRFAATGETSRSMDAPGTPMGLRADGEEFPMEAMISQAGEGRRKIATVILRDISERLRAENALRESEERLRLVVQAINDVIWEWDVRSTTLRWSEGAHLVFRYPAEEMGTTIEWWAERIHPEDRERIITGFDGLVHGTGGVWSDEYRFRRGDGSYATVLDRGYVQRDERGIPLKAIGAMMDITERRRNEDAQRFLAQASALLDNSLDPAVTLPGLSRLLVPTYADFCFIDLREEGDGPLRRVAVAHAIPTQEPLLSGPEPGSPSPGGWSGEEPSPVAPDAGTSGSGILRPAESISIDRPILISPAMGSSLDLLEGTDRRVHELFARLGVHSLMMVPLSAHDRVLGILTLGTAESGRGYGPRDLMFAEDLARRVAAALENARLYAEAQRAVRAREEILNIVSHDLRNPLSSVKMSAELLRDTEQERREDKRKWLSMISRAAIQMEEMIGDLLDSARIDSGGFSVEPVDQDVATLVMEIGEVFSPLAAEKEIRVVCRVPADLGTVRMDAAQIQRVLSNLINNAIKFTPGGGTIVVEAVRADAEVRFSIADTGPGIPADELPHVFDRYWQARRGDRRGVGLGLAIAEGIVSAHGGRIWAESTEGSGTVFHFTLPASPPAAGG